MYPPVGVFAPELPLPGRPEELPGRPSGVGADGLASADLANKPARGSRRAQAKQMSDWQTLQ